MLKKFVPLFLTLCTTILSAAPTCTITPIDEHSSDVQVNFNVDAGDCLYHDYLSFSTDHPAITLSPARASSTPREQYDTGFNNTKLAYYEPVTFSFRAETENAQTPDAHLHVSYYQKNTHKIEHASFPIVMNNPPASIVEQLAAEESTMHSHKTTTPPQEAEPKKPSSWSSYFSDTLQNTESMALRLILALLLGLILSLTPCIYPMIPITVGVLQSHSTKSVGRNFLLALCYVIGIATTFALLGLLASCTGKLCGNLLARPWFIIAIVALLVYMAGSMIGFYDMYIPRFLQSSKSSNHNGSIISIFMLGAVSGSIASPCLSPGLLLLLTLVTTLGSTLLGFLLLFFFGIGLGIPLLIIGTFSSSMNALPRAGMWMVEIKKAFGFIILATSLHFLSNILPWTAIMWIASFLTLGAGLFYLHEATKSVGVWKKIHNVIGMILTAAFVVMAAKSYQAMHQCQCETSPTSAWIHSYEEGIEHAKRENKLLFLDVSAPYCSICKAIDRTLFCCVDVQKKLNDYVTVKLEDIDQSVAEKFHVVGVPTFIVIDPHHEKEIARWGAELYDIEPTEFIAQLTR
jgi:thiol:disulfide interchange protein DsbD